MSALAGAFAVAMLLPSQAHAYIDPGTGSMLLQGLIAAIAGVAVTVRLYWYKIKAALGLRKEEDQPATSDDGAKKES
jgi:hypothetical protein